MQKKTRRRAVKGPWRAGRGSHKAPQIITAGDMKPAGAWVNAAPLAAQNEAPAVTIGPPGLGQAGGSRGGGATLLRGSSLQNDVAACGFRFLTIRRTSATV